MITQHELMSHLHYCPYSGHFTWISHPSPKQVKLAGKRAGGIHKSTGYVRIRLFEKLYSAHRLAFLYMTGRWPGYTDHINMVRHDNRWANLREATKSQNNANCAPRAKSGRKGVRKRGNKFEASIGVDGKFVHLGTFATIEDASEAYRKKAEELFGKFARHL